MMKPAADVRIGDRIEAGYVAGIEHMGPADAIRLYLRTMPNGAGGMLRGARVGTLPLLPSDHVAVTNTADRQSWPARDGFCARGRCQIRHHAPHP